MQARHKTYVVHRQFSSHRPDPLVDQMATTANQLHVWAEEAQRENFDQRKKKKSQVWF